MITLPSFSFSKSLLYVFNMSAKVALESVKRNATQAERTIIELKNELESLTATYNNLQCQQLRAENEKLSFAVEAAKKNLINLETKNGIKQIGIVLNENVQVTNDGEDNKKQSLSKTDIKSSDAKVKNEKKNVNKKKTAEVNKNNDTTGKESEVIDVGRFDLRIAKIEHVQKHPDADTLYVLKINCGEDKPRTVCSGLVKFVPIEDLENKYVLLLCNLKSAKMRGITSEAMIMCASRPDAIEVLSPPTGCKPGEAVHCEGYTRNPDLIMNPKKKIFETVAPDLSTNDILQACYKGVPLNVPGKGNIVAATLKNCPVK